MSRAARMRTSRLFASQPRAKVCTPRAAARRTARCTSAPNARRPCLPCQTRCSRPAASASFFAKRLWRTSAVATALRRRFCITSAAFARRRASARRKRSRRAKAHRKLRCSAATALNRVLSRRSFLTRATAFFLRRRLCAEIAARMSAARRRCARTTAMSRFAFRARYKRWMRVAMRRLRATSSARAKARVRSVHASQAWATNLRTCRSQARAMRR
mmetsp:Transcript_17748/g.60963  ORF Transcript_17748/g.60963 Transcript_17748/m.60963 type:complete len:216 (+) Transcript_17748:811-1458(+)